MDIVIGRFRGSAFVRHLLLRMEAFLDEYIAAWGIGADAGGPLFRTTGRSTGTPHRMTQQDAYRLIERHARRAGIKTKIGNHSLRATGITDYPEKRRLALRGLQDGESLRHPHYAAL